MKQPKPVKAWMATLSGRLVDVVWFGKGAKAEANRCVSYWGQPNPHDRYGVVEVLITPIVKKPRKAKGKKR